jgi:hypothetical protein
MIGSEMAPNRRGLKRVAAPPHVPLQLRKKTLSCLSSSREGKCCGRWHFTLVNVDRSKLLSTTADDEEGEEEGADGVPAATDTTAAAQMHDTYDTAQGVKTKQQ